MFPEAEIRSFPEHPLLSAPESLFFALYLENGNCFLRPGVCTSVHETGKATFLFKVGGGLSFITLIHFWEEKGLPDCQCCALSINEHTQSRGAYY